MALYVFFNTKNGLWYVMVYVFFLFVLFVCLFGCFVVVWYTIFRESSLLSRGLAGSSTNTYSDTL